MPGISHLTFSTFNLKCRILNRRVKLFIKQIQSDIEVMGMHSGIALEAIQ
jgi:hypothetical protein